MSDGIKLNQGIVTSLAGTDLVVAADSVGSLRPITLTNLLALIRDNIKIGGRNLLKGANTDITTNNQILIGKYEFGNSLPVKGETYTLSLCYTLKGTSIRASLFGGEIYNPFTFTTNGERIIEQKTMFVVQDIPSYITSAKGFQFYRANTSDTYPAVIHWAVLTKGNLGVVDWTPAPEDLSGGVILRNSIGYDLKKGGSHDRGNNNRRRSYTLYTKGGVIQRLAERDTDRRAGISGTGNMLGRLRDTGLLHRGCKFILRVPSKYQSLELRNLGSAEEECRYYPSLYTCGRIDSAVPRPEKQRVATVVPAEHGTGVRLTRKEVTHV